MKNRADLPTAEVARARSVRVAAGVVAVLCGAVAGGLDGEAPAASASLLAGASSNIAAPTDRWAWPVPPPDRVVAGFVAPASPYASGHRGVDIATSTGAAVAAPADGVVSFSGVVVDRPVVTLRLDDGTLASFEPVVGTVAVGGRIGRGEAFGSVARGGHCDEVCLHVGVRVDGAYVSPMLFYAGVPAAVLLPLEPEG